MPRSSRLLRTALTLAVTTALAAVPLVSTAAPHTTARTSATQSAVTSGGPGRLFPARIELPDAFLPEGIAIRGTTAYFGSRADGDIYAASLVTGRGRVISQGTGTPSVGLKVDHRKRLFVSGGPAGDARVVDTRTGRILRSYQLATGTTFINDVVLTKRVAWFTDSQNAVLYGLPLGPRGKLPHPSRVIRLPLGGDWVQATGFNANGITQTPDGRALLVVNSGSGLLFRVNPRTGVARQVDLGGALLTNGDGMLLLGRTLYVVQNRLNQVAVVRLDRSGRSGVVTGALESLDFDVPTTVAAFGRWLYLPNARFTTPPTPQTPYWVTRISR
jgi:sugar lactone lactonase YvrE